MSKNNWMICRSAATLGVDTWERTQSTCSVPWEPDEDEPRPAMPRAAMPRSESKVTNSATLAFVIDETQLEEIGVPIVRANRRTEWFRAPVAQLPKRGPHISLSLLALSVEDE